MIIAANTASFQPGPEIGTLWMTESDFPAKSDEGSAALTGPRHDLETPGATFDLFPGIYCPPLMIHFGYLHARHATSRHLSVSARKRWKVPVTELTRNTCAVCGEERSPGDVWFLVAENRWEDRLKVLHWNERLAAREGVQRACSARHVEELVVHWMTTGSLDYPFARAALGAGPPRRLFKGWPAPDELDVLETGQIGDLAVHREGIEHVLSEHPESLRAILDALARALQKETVPGIPTAREQEGDASSTLARAV